MFFLLERPGKGGEFFRVLIPGLNGGGDGVHSFTALFLFFADVNECNSSPCRNGGRCVDMLGGFMCFCPEGRVGEYCQFSKKRTHYLSNS